MGGMIEPLSSFTAIVTMANLVAGLALLFRLALAKLASRYPFLFIYLIIDAVGSASGILIPVRSNLYAYAYMATQVASIAAVAAVLLEMCKLTLATHPALASFSRAVVGYVAVGSGVIAALTIFLDDEIRPAQSMVLHRFFTVERIMDLALVVFLLAIIMFLTWFPVKVCRNIATYATGFAVYFFARSFVLLMVNRLPPDYVDAMSALMLCISLTCLISWIWSLRPEGEEIITVTGHRWNPGAFDRLSRQLNSINGAVARLGRQ